MEVNQLLHLLAVVMSCVLVATVWCEEEHQAGSQLQDSEVSHTQKRSIADLPAGELSYGVGYSDDDLTDKRSSLFRFGKRSSLFRFGKRGSLFRFGKRGSLFRFGKRGSLFRFGKRDGGEDMSADQWEMYPDVYVSDDDMKRAVKSFHWGRETEE